MKIELHVERLYWYSKLVPEYQSPISKSDILLQLWVEWMDGQPDINLFGVHREIFSESCRFRPKLDCIYHFPVDLELNEIQFDSKWNRKWYSNLISVDLTGIKGLFPWIYRRKHTTAWQSINCSEVRDFGDIVLKPIPLTDLNWRPLYKLLKAFLPLTDWNCKAII